MEITVAEIKKSIEAILNSDVSNAFVSSLGRSAAVGGFILSENGLIASIDSPVAIYFSIFIPTFIMIALMAIESGRLIFLRRANSKFVEDIRLIHESISSNQELNLQQVTIFIDHQRTTTSGKAFRYGSSTFNVIIDAVSGAAAVFINFMIPTVLKKRFGDEDIRLASYIVAAIIALYCGLASCASNKKAWQPLDEKRNELRDSLQRYALFSQNHTVRDALANLDGAEPQPGL